MRAVVVNGFVTDAREKGVSGVARRPRSLSVQPKPSCQMIFPFWVRATATPVARPTAISRALSAVAGFLGLSLPLSAQQTDRPDFFSALNNSLLRFPSLALSDGQRFSFLSAFTWMEPTPPDFLPALKATAPPKPNASAPPGKDSSKEVKEVVDMQRSNLFDYASGEVGMLYG